jgi:cytoskeletal protein CcmA (bactofilin family)
MSWLAPRRKTPPLAIPNVPRTATFIEEGCQLSGQLHFQSGVRIEGRIEGEVRARGTVVVGETGVVDASIFADVVVVLGEVDGDINATTLVALHKGARVRSDITTAGIVVEPGSNFRGSIVIGPEETPALAEGSRDDALDGTTRLVIDDGDDPVVNIHPVAAGRR